MKNLLLLMAVLFVFGCKKETPNPSSPSPPPQPATASNYFVLNGPNHTNDTFAYNTDLYGHWNTPSMTTVLEGTDSISGWMSFLLSVTGSTTGQFTVSQSPMASWVQPYPDPVFTVNITRYDTVGGFIEGTVNGTVSSGNVSVTGKFKVPRMPDI